MIIIQALEMNKICYDKIIVDGGIIFMKKK